LSQCASILDAYIQSCYGLVDGARIINQGFWIGIAFYRQRKARELLQQSICIALCQARACMQSTRAVARVVVSGVA
jgi:hypothetical protein